MGAFHSSGSNPGNRGVRGRFALRASGIATPRTPLFPELFRSFETHPIQMDARQLCVCFWIMKLVLFSKQCE